ncbi:MAG: S41 family peptidase [Candidatus Marisimplicoccus sp.]
MKKFKFCLLALILVFSSCKKSDDEDPNIIRIETDLEIIDFIWKGLNQYYYWQESVVNLSDSKKESESDYAYFLSQNPDPENFFNTLLHPDDNFSWIVDDYVELENMLQGIDISDGMEFGLYVECNDQNIFGFVRYVQKDSDAESKGVKRGMVFSNINGTRLTRDNYRDLLFNNSSSSYTIRFSEISYNQNNQCANIIPGQEDLTLIKSRIVKNPIHISKIIENGGQKIGYLMYNQFLGVVESEGKDYNSELNDAFANFLSNGINDLVIDLRYNPGGRISTSINLASMITGQFNNQVFAKERWNSKLMNYWDENSPESLLNRFTNKLGNNQSIFSLNLDRVFVLTSARTASASELLINGLEPYIDVIHIGDFTVGKNQGSITVYDYINDSRDKNPNHMYAMQPIVLKIGNVAGYTDFPDGLEPDIFIKESLLNPGILGDVEEPLLKIAIDQISGDAISIENNYLFKEISTPKDELKEKIIIDDIIIK